MSKRKRLAPILVVARVGAPVPGRQVNEHDGDEATGSGSVRSDRLGSGTARRDVRKVNPALSAAMDDTALRQHLVTLLRGRDAHLDFDSAINNLPPELRGARPKGQPHTPWRLVEHLRIAQWDILEFCRDAGHVSPAWPEGYWPATDAPAGDDGWQASVDAFRRDHRAMCDLVSDPASDLFAVLPWGDGQTLLRETLLVADHNAYHLGQLVTLRSLLGDWPPRA